MIKSGNLWLYCLVNAQLRHIIFELHVLRRAKQDYFVHNHL